MNATLVQNNLSPSLPPLPFFLPFPTSTPPFFHWRSQLTLLLYWLSKVELKMWHRTLLQCVQTSLTGRCEVPTHGSAEANISLGKHQ